MKTLHISVYDIASSELLWVAISATFTPSVGHVVSGNPKPVQPPITQSVIAGEHDTNRDLVLAAGHTLEEFAYGSLPDGFRQLVPTDGSAPPLQLGKRYLLVLEGEASIRMPFDGTM